MQDAGSCPAEIVRAHVTESRVLRSKLDKLGDSRRRLERPAPRDQPDSPAGLLPAHQEVVRKKLTAESAPVPGQVVGEQC